MWIICCRGWDIAKDEQEVIKFRLKEAVIGNNQEILKYKPEGERLSTAYYRPEN